MCLINRCANGIDKVWETIIVGASVKGYMHMKSLWFSEIKTSWTISPITTIGIQSIYEMMKYIGSLPIPPLPTTMETNFIEKDY